jgi:hypothetical protein
LHRKLQIVPNYTSIVKERFFSQSIESIAEDSKEEHLWKTIELFVVAEDS